MREYPEEPSVIATAAIDGDIRFEWSLQCDTDGLYRWYLFGKALRLSGDSVQAAELALREFVTKTIQGTLRFTMVGDRRPCGREEKASPSTPVVRRRES